MLLTFSRDSFVEAIKSGRKEHTIRKDEKNRWKKGNTIQFWRGNPRNTMGKIKPYQFGIGVCVLVLPIRIYPNENRFIIGDGDKGEFKSIGALNELAENDGFKDWEDMKT